MTRENKQPSVITISEKDLRTLVTEVVEEVLRTHGIINEFAMSSKEYRSKIRGQARQILENWCLVYFCCRTKYPTTNIDHWRRELMAAMHNISVASLKGGKADNVLAQTWHDIGYDNNHERLTNSVIPKFKKEGIDVDKYAVDIDNTCQAFTKSAGEILFAIPSPQKTNEYVFALGSQPVLEE